MGFADVFFRITGSKWFIAGIGIMMTFLLILTYQQMKTSSNFIGITVFVINILAVLLCLWKFAEVSSSKIPTTSQNWN